VNSNSDFVAPLVRSLRKWIEEGRTEELGDWVLDAKTDLNTILPVPPTGIVPILKPGSPERDGVFATLSAASSPILSRVGQFISIAALRTQSPIEFYMLMGLVLCAFERSDNVLFAIDDSGTFGVKMLPASSEVIIEPQRQIGDYRVDFLVSWTETNCIMSPIN
jgi:hypothetical protein